MNSVQNMKFTSINAKIRNFKNEKIFNYLIDHLIEFGLDCYRFTKSFGLALTGRTCLGKNILPELGQARICARPS